MGYGSVLERLTTDEEVPGSNLGAFLGFGEIQIQVPPVELQTLEISNSQLQNKAVVIYFLSN